MSYEFTRLLISAGLMFCIFGALVQTGELLAIIKRVRPNKTPSRIMFVLGGFLITVGICVGLLG